MIILVNYWLFACLWYCQIICQIPLSASPRLPLPLPPPLPCLPPPIRTFAIDWFTRRPLPVIFQTDIVRFPPPSFTTDSFSSSRRRPLTSGMTTTAWRWLTGVTVTSWRLATTTVVIFSHHVTVPWRHLTPTSSLKLRLVACPLIQVCPIHPVEPCENLVNSYSSKLRYTNRWRSK